MGKKRNIDDKQTHKVEYLALIINKQRTRNKFSSNLNLHQIFNLVPTEKVEKFSCLFLAVFFSQSTFGYSIQTILYVVNYQWDLLNYFFGLLKNKCQVLLICLSISFVHPKTTERPHER